MPQPINSIVSIATNTLGANGKVNKIEPIAPLTTAGIAKGSMSYQAMNYILNNYSEWLSWHTEEDASIRTDFASADSSLQGQINAIKLQIEKERVSVGEIIEITGDSTNPATLKGYGTWSSFGAGQVLVGVGSHTDSRAEAKTWSDGDSEGAYSHMQATNEVGTHGHTAQAVADHTHPLATETGGSQDLVAMAISDNADENPTGTNSGLGGGHTPVIDDSVAPTVAMNNTQPTLAVYRWKRDS